MSMTISELARTAGVGVETVRYYQRRGLLPDPRPTTTGRSAGTRHYGPGEAQRLRFVRQAQKAGFTLEEIAALLEMDRTGDRPRARAMAQARIALLDARIAELTDARAALARLAEACAGGDAGPCPILGAFEAADKAKATGNEGR
jgi:MerR family mercuric resistance operon transcriptional regulator